MRLHGVETWCRQGRGGRWIWEVLKGRGLLQMIKTGWLNVANAMSVIIYPLSQGNLPRALLPWTSLI